MYEYHYRDLIPLPSPIRPIDIQAQAILRSISENRQIQRQKLLANTDILRARWPRTISGDERTRTRSESLWRIEPIRPRSILSILDTEKRFHAVFVSAAIRYVVVELNRLVGLAARVRMVRARLIGEAHCGQEEGQRQVAEHLGLPLCFWESWCLFAGRGGITSVATYHFCLDDFLMGV